MTTTTIITTITTITPIWTRIQDEGFSRGHLIWIVNDRFLNTKLNDDDFFFRVFKDFHESIGQSPKQRKIVFSSNAIPQIHWKTFWASYGDISGFCSRNVKCLRFGKTSCSRIIGLFFCVSLFSFNHRTCSIMMMPVPMWSTVNWCKVAQNYPIYLNQYG